MKHIVSFILAVLTLSVSAQDRKPIGGPCEDCQLMFDGMPAQLASRTVLAPAGEPGAPLIIRGVIFKPDGKTPAPGVVLYVYQTDNTGRYSKSKNQQHGGRHGHLRGWMKTNEQGQYEFKTIRPASYPGSKSPQHIHPIIYEPGKGYYWIDEYQFEDDPYLTDNERSKAANRGGSGTIKLTKDKTGTWQGTRNIILGLNVH